MIDFPANPTLGQQFTAAGVTWTWDGVKWTASGLGVAYLPLAGGTMLGPIVLAADPAAALQPATKQYVDGASFGGFVNKFRNGTMDVWQRGSPITPVNGTYTADGWLINWAGAAPSVSMQANSGGNFFKSRNALAMTGVSGNTALQLAHRIESNVSSPLGGFNVTVQFKVSQTTGATITPQLLIQHASVENNFATTPADVGPVNLQPLPNNTWTTLAYTFPISQASAFLGLQVQLLFGAITSGAVYVSDADIRVTPGWPVGLCANPPPPELRHVQAERAFCQRYYWDPANGAASPYGFTLGGPSPGAQAYTYAPIILPVQMRAIPTAAVRNQNYSGASSVTISPATSQTCASSVVTTLASGNYYIQFNCSFNAEL